MSLLGPNKIDKNVTFYSAFFNYTSVPFIISKTWIASKFSEVSLIEIDIKISKRIPNNTATKADPKTTPLYLGM